MRLRRRARGARVHARAGARADRRVDRRARLRLHVRARAPPGDAPCGARAPGARDADGVQRARPAGEPRRRPRRGLRRLLVRAGPHVSPRRSPQLGARRAFVVHGVGGHRRALAVRAEPRLRGRRRRRTRVASSTRADARARAVRPGGARAAAARPRTPRRSGHPRRQSAAPKRDAVAPERCGRRSSPPGHADDLREGIERRAAATLDAGRRRDGSRSSSAFSRGAA